MLNAGGQENTFSNLREGKHLHPFKGRGNLAGKTATEEWPREGKGKGSRFRWTYLMRQNRRKKTVRGPSVRGVTGPGKGAFDLKGRPLNDPKKEKAADGKLTSQELM